MIVIYRSQVNIDPDLQRILDTLAFSMDLGTAEPGMLPGVSPKNDTQDCLY